MKKKMKYLGGLLLEVGCCGAFLMLLFGINLLFV